jgi:hypothetical protein
MVDIATLQSGGTNEYSRFGLTIKLWQAFVGTTGAAYAKVSVVSDKLTLINNGEIDSDNRPWMVSIQEGGSTFGASLSKIQLTNVAESTNGLSAGESLYFVKKPKLMAFTFNGIETVSSSDSLRMNFISPQYLPMNSTDSTTRANVVVLQSNRANAFQFGGDSSDRAYYVIGANNSIPMGSILYNKNGFFQLYTGNVNGTLNFVDYNYGPNTIKIAFNSASIEPNAYPDMADYVIHVPEYTTDSDGAPYAYKIDVGNAETSNPSFTQSGSNYLGYGAVSSYPYPDNVANNYESGFMSMRGGTATVSQSSANINYLGSVAHALYTFSAANTSVGNGTAYSSKFGKGDTILDSNGYLVRLTDLNCNIAGGVGGSALPGQLTGADGLKCSQTSAFTVNQLNTANTPLVVLDSQANAGDTLILVGGPLVNSLTASVVSEIQPNEAMVKVVGNKIVVAGYSAADTTAAANSLINWLSNHRNE